jgi:hypothetical protein|nr:MAG TPA: Pectate lyase [Caudoviricetes sp.]
MDFSKINLLGVDIFCKDLAARNVPYADVVKDFKADNTGVTDATESVQNAVDSLNSIIVFRPGIYKLKSIKIPSFTTLIGYGAKIIADANNVFINNSDGSKGGYDANKNITICGFDFSADAVGTCTEVGFSHCENITVKDCAFHDNSAWHMIELNSCKNSTIENCTFYNNKVVSGSSEMLQLDSAVNQTGFPWFGPYDSTPCKNIKITSCSFDNSMNAIAEDGLNSAIGNHTESDIRNIVISNCTFTGFTIALKFIALYDSEIIGCNINKCGCGMLFYGDAENILISGNVITGDRTDNTPSENVEKRGIFFNNSKKLTIKNITVIGNSISNFRNHGISVECTNGIVANNHIFNNSYHGIVCGYNSYNVVVENNIVFNNAAIAPRKYDIGINISGDLSPLGKIKITNNTCGSLYAYYISDTAIPGNVSGNICSGTFNPGVVTSGFFNATYNNTDNSEHNSENVSATISNLAVAYKANAWNHVCSISIARSGFYFIKAGITIPNVTLNATLDIEGVASFIRSSLKCDGSLSSFAISASDIQYIKAGTILNMRLYPTADMTYVYSGIIRAILLPIDCEVK